MHWHGVYAGNATHTTDKGGIDEVTTSKDEGIGRASVDEHFSGSNPALHGLAPNIAVVSTVTLTENDKKGYVDASVNISSKNFPATEATITDPNGKSILLTGAAAYGTPMNLSNGKVASSASIMVCITIDNKGNFTGVVYGGKTYSVGAWNKMQTDRPAGPYKRNQIPNQSQ